MDPILHDPPPRPSPPRIPDLAIALRPYQEAAIAAVKNASQRGVQRALVRMPTGTGKTVVFAHLIRRRSGRALVLAHRDELIRRRPVHWVPMGDGRFTLTTGQGSLVLRSRGDEADRWDVLQLPLQEPPRILATGLDLGYAQGFAEDHAQAMGAGALIAREAGWRSLEPTEKQERMLRRLGIPRRSISTRGQASDAITAALAVAEVAS